MAVASQAPPAKLGVVAVEAALGRRMIERREPIGCLARAVAFGPLNALALSCDCNQRLSEIGGPEVVSYSDMMGEYAKRRGLRRLLVLVPALTPRLSGLWLGLVGPPNATAPFFTAVP